MKVVFDNALHHKFLPQIFAVSFLAAVGTFVYTGVFAEAPYAGPGYESAQVAHTEAGSFQGAGLNPAYFEKKRGATADQVLQYGEVARGNNNITKYNGNTYDEWKVEQPWCANFVSWVYKQAGHPFTGGLSGGWRYASTANLKTYLQKNGTRITDPNKVKPGDIFWKSGHMGLIISDGTVNGKYNTIEGNTWGADNKHRVLKKTQSTSVEVYRPTIKTPPPPSGGWGGNCVIVNMAAVLTGRTVTAPC